jgi:hypothetical protein
MRICRRVEWMGVVSDSEGLVMFITGGDEDTPRNISEWHKIL